MATATGGRTDTLLADAVRGSVTRIADLDDGVVAALPRDEWGAGDFVLAEVTDVVPAPHQIETATGRMVDVIAGDLVVGALGVRSATLEVVGDWRDVGGDLRLHALTRAGVFGRATSVTPFARPALVPLVYRGHILRDGVKATMGDAVCPVERLPFDIPVVIVIGTSMSAGKTTSVITIVRRLHRMGLSVAGTKVTGVARYREILGMQDAGAHPVADFVDAGLPSTICPPEQYREALGHVLSLIAAGAPDVVVVECGASPLEPYNVDVAVAALRPHVRCTVLCASDPYAVLGVAHAFHARPAVVAGRATSTTAGIALVEKLTGARCLNLLDPDDLPQLDALLSERLEL